MARAAAISPASVQRLWAASDIKPHLSRTFKLSNDKRFEEKFWDVIGLYLNPPDKALVLCCDEKSQCQALERTQPGLPLGIGHIRTKTHDYVRHGTLTLFAALNYLEGKLITRLAPRHRHQEWLAFLKTIDEETPADLDIHIIADNYATHKHPAVSRWLDRHSRFHMHYTPTSSSWMNLVERFFRDLTEFITEKTFASTRELADAIIAFLAARNENPRQLRVESQGRRHPAQDQRRPSGARRRPVGKQRYFRDGTLAELPPTGDQVALFRPRPSRLERTCVNEPRHVWRSWISRKEFADPYARPRCLQVRGSPSEPGIKRQTAKLSWRLGPFATAKS